MKPVNRAVLYLLIASVLGLSACVVGPNRGNGHDREQSNTRSDHDDARHDDSDRRCNPNDDHHGDDCRAPEHH
jgi:hypothetical protein